MGGFEQVVGRSPSRPVRIYDVAGRAGVSLATVSAVTTGKRPVAAATRQRVLRAIEELGYHANANAQALVKGSTNTLALLIPPLGAWQNVMEMFVTLILDAASRSGYDVLVSIATEDDESFQRLVAEQRVDGVLLLEVFLDDRRIERLRSLRFPFVAIGRPAHYETIDCVDVDFVEVVGSLVDFLADLGHRRVALMNSPQHLYDRGHGPARRCEEGFFAACERRELDGTVLRCERSNRGGFGETEWALEHHRATAFVVANYFILGSLYQTIADSGRRIPDDVSVVAVSDLRVHPDLHPVPTVAPHAIDEMSETAVRMMVERLSEPSLAPRCRLLSRSIELGGSTAPPPAGLDHSSSRLAGRAAALA